MQNSEKRPCLPVKLTLEILDKLIATLPLDVDDPAWEDFHELLWGKNQDSGVMLDLLVLARVALVHLSARPTLQQPTYKRHRGSP